LLALWIVRRWLGAPPPIVVGGTGGSGTRIVQAVLARAGASMGARLNEAGDAMDFEPFLDATINPVLTVTRSLDYRLDDVPECLRRTALRDFDQAVGCYRGERPTGGRWGWKNPRSMYVLPLIHARFPQMNFVHVLRDGRDMALSDNRNQLRKHYEALFGEPASEHDNRAALRLWAATNAAVADWGERVLGPRYLRLRFEDLCHDPANSCAALARRLGLPIVAGHGLASIVAAPATIGRWRRAPAAAPIEPSAIAALAAFGYR
jgi:hypothetical protein